MFSQEPLKTLRGAGCTVLESARTKRSDRRESHMSSTANRTEHGSVNKVVALGATTVGSGAGIDRVTSAGTGPKTAADAGPPGTNVGTR
jgi:hypothetical protein